MVSLGDQVFVRLVNEPGERIYPATVTVPDGPDCKCITCQVFGASLTLSRIQAYRLGTVGADIAPSYALQPIDFAIFDAATKEGASG